MLFKFIVVRKLQGFESPALVLMPLKDTHQLAIRKRWAEYITFAIVGCDKVTVHTCILK